MAHAEQIEFCKSVKEKFPLYFSERLVVDIGSYDVNGNNQYLFESCLYLGVDLLPGKNVDFSTRADQFGLPDESVDTVISTECFEHDQHYKETLKNIIRMLKPGGLFIFTCATTGRAEHGTRNTTPADAPFILAFEHWGDYYKNLDEADIRNVLDIEAIFEQFQFETNTQSHDLYFWGVKKGVLQHRHDYSFQLERNGIKQHLARLQQHIEEKNQHIALIEEERTKLENFVHHLNQHLDEKNQHITLIDEERTRLEKIIHHLNQHLDEKNQHISLIDETCTGLKLLLTEKENALHLIQNSRSWKLTKIFRKMAIYLEKGIVN